MLKIVDLGPTLAQNSSLILIKDFDLSSFYFEMKILLVIIWPVLWEDQVS